ncbi:heparinase II/III family protein [Devosia sp. CAU 1758]
MPARRSPSLPAARCFEFLNLTGQLDEIGWDGPARSKLWRYNQHYFDDLNAVDAASRNDWQHDIIDSWIRQNAPGAGVGWEPYPTSLRIVNWIKWARAGASLPEGFALSLATQTRYLAQRLEWHLLGNHLFANAKALVFAGLYFEGKEAQGWLKQGAAILSKEIEEQILPDGGHFELSTMYHVLAYEDVLDLLNMIGTAPDAVFPSSAPLGDMLTSRVGPMGQWLKTLCHADGEISFFNDAALGIAPSVAEVIAYAGRLGFPVAQSTGSLWLSSSGYARLEAGGMLVLFDMAVVGPTYLPAHGHADTLSIEISIGERRVIVNGGTSEYGVGPERLRQRSTPAHATVTVDDSNSSDVWSGFRVGRRAKVLDATFVGGSSSVHASAAHDGYFGRNGIRHHRRSLDLSESELVVRDEITGTGQHSIRIVFPLGEGLLPFVHEAGAVCVADAEGAKIMVLRASGDAVLTIEPATWHPRFGVSVPTSRIVISYTGSLPWAHETMIGMAP